MLSVPPQPTIFRLSLSFSLSSVISIFPVYFLSLNLYSFPSLKIRKIFLNKNTPQNDAIKGNASLIPGYSCHNFFPKTKITEINQVNNSQATK